MPIFSQLFVILTVQTSGTYFFYHVRSNWLTHAGHCRRCLEREWLVFRFFFGFCILQLNRKPNKPKTVSALSARDREEEEEGTAHAVRLHCDAAGGKAWWMQTNLLCYSIAFNQVWNNNCGRRAQPSKRTPSEIVHLNFLQPLCVPPSSTDITCTCTLQELSLSGLTRSELLPV